MTQPSHCNECRVIFYDRPLLQAEIEHIARTVSEGAAEAELNERLSDEHAQH